MTLRENIRHALRLTSNWDCLAMHRMLMAERAMGMQHRSVFARVQKLLRMLVAGREFNQSSLALALGRAAKTIQRDVDFLRQQGIRISYLKARHSYQLEPGQNHPWLKQGTL